MYLPCPVTAEKLPSLLVWLYDSHTCVYCGLGFLYFAMGKQFAHQVRLYGIACRGGVYLCSLDFSLGPFDQCRVREELSSWSLFWLCPCECWTHCKRSLIWIVIILEQIRLMLSAICAPSAGPHKVSYHICHISFCRLDSIVGEAVDDEHRTMSREPMIELLFWHVYKVYMLFAATCGLH